MRKRLQRAFYMRDTIKVAKDLIGKFIVRKTGKKRKAGMIVETEAYLGVRDRASHAFEGKLTPRNAAEYLEGGHTYIYLCYGLYWQLNVTTKKEGIPECVLIRALEPAGRIQPKEKPASGPGLVCKWLKIDGSFNGEDLVTSRKLWIEDRGVKIGKGEIISSKRIGIDYAKEWAQKPLRFLLKDNPFVSHPPKTKIKRTKR